MTERLAVKDQLNINGNNYDRSLIIIELSGKGVIDFTSTDITEYIQAINYTETSTVEEGRVLGSRRASFYGFSGIASEGTLKLIDAGIGKLDEIAREAGLPSLIWMGQGTVGSRVDITVSYVTYNGLEVIDTLQGIFFTSRNNGADVDTALQASEATVMIGRIDWGVNTGATEV